MLTYDPKTPKPQNPKTPMNDYINFYLCY